MGYSIKELESLSGVKAHTIRIWEQRYGFLKPARTTTNIRTYTNEELKTLLNVALLNKYGYKVSHINQMYPEQRAAAILHLTQPEARKEALINYLIACMIDVQQGEFEEAINKQIKEHHLPETLHTVVFPFMEKTGILWQANRINPAQEHIVSNIIRQKIISAIDALPPGTQKEPLFLLFLPEDEHHELGLLIVYYLLREKNIPVLYLGANVPMSDVAYLINIRQPQFLYLHLTSFPRYFRFDKFLQQLSSFTGTKVFISGSVTWEYQKTLPQNTVFLTTFTQVLQTISSL